MTKRVQFVWKAQKMKDTFSFLVATVMGIGLFPKAPGTFGTVAAIPIVFFLRDESFFCRVIFWTLLTLVGIWAAAAFDQKMKSNDDSRIVIDEVIGFGIAAWTVGHDLKAGVLAFLLFRLFDILKPSPIRHLDRWSKNQSRTFYRGFGVVVDDIVAGFMSLSVIFLLQRLSII